MRKRLLLTLLIPMLLFAGCEDDITSDDTHYKELKNQFKRVENSRNLYYDRETKIAYIIFREEKNADLRTASGFGYMSPYYAPNGKPYRYIDGKLKEVGE